MNRHPRTQGEGDVGSTAAFSVLFVVPAGLAVSFWILLRVFHTAVGLGGIAFVPWLLVVLGPAIISGAVAQWAAGAPAPRPEPLGGLRSARGEPRRSSWS